VTASFQYPASYSAEVDEVINKHKKLRPKKIVRLETSQRVFEPKPNFKKSKQTVASKIHFFIRTSKILCCAAESYSTLEGPPLTLPDCLKSLFGQQP
jgi:hypothetical protein